MQHVRIGKHRRGMITAGALVSVAAGGALAAPLPRPADAATSRVVTIDGVGLIPAGSDHYATVLRLKQKGAFIAIYHTTYRGTLTAHVSVDRDNHTIYRAMMSSTTKGRTYFYVWSQFRSRAQTGRLVAYLTIQAGSTKVTKELPFTLKP